MSKIMRQDVIEAVSADPGMAAEVDAEWQDTPDLTVGQRLYALRQLCAGVLRRHGHEVAW